MNDPEIAAALRAREPDAIAALFDAYAESLFQYCWLALRSREAAQIAVRDTLAAAVAHADQLRDPAQLRQWLYALARAECHRRNPVPAASADEPPARPSQPDADSRVVAWNAVTSMSPGATEMLDLSARHGMTPADIALVLGVTEAEVSVLLDAAKDELSQSLGAQLIVRRVGFDCSGLTAAVRGWAGVMTPAARDRVLTHASDCAVCGRHTPRSVSATRVYGLLPAPLPDPGMRGEVLAGLAGTAPTATASATPASAVTAPAIAPVTPASTAPVMPPPASDARRFRVGRKRLLMGIAAAGVAAAAAAALVLAGLPGTGHGPAGSGVTAASSPLQTNGSGEGSPSRMGAIGATPAPRPGHGKHSPPSPAVRAPGGLPPVRDGQPLFLSAAQQRGGGAGSQPPAPPAPPRRHAGPSPASRGTLSVSPGTLDLGTGSAGTIVLTANGGPVTWSASSSSGWVRLSASSGSVAAGQSATVTVTVTRHRAGGSAVISFAPGGEDVQVTWAPRPAPSPSPSPQPSGGDTDSPRPPPSTPPGHHRHPRCPRKSPSPGDSSPSGQSPPTQSPPTQSPPTQTSPATAGSP